MNSFTGGVSGGGPSLRKAIGAKTASDERKETPVARRKSDAGVIVGDEHKVEDAWIGALFPNYVLGCVGSVPLVHSAYLQLETGGEADEEHENPHTTYRWRHDDLRLNPFFFFVQILVYIFPLSGFYGGNTSRAIGSGVTTVLFLLFLVPTVALSAAKVKDFKVPRSLQDSLHSRGTTYYYTLATLMGDMALASFLCLSAMSVQPTSLFSLLTLESVSAPTQTLLFCVAVGVVFTWIYAANTAAAEAQRKPGAEHKQALPVLTSATCVVNLLYVPLTLTLMRALKCNPVDSKGCWRGTHAVHLFFGFFSLQHLLVVAAMFTPMLGLCRAMQPSCVPYFTTLDKVAKFLLCAVAVFGDAVPLLTFAAASSFILLATLRRGDGGTALFTARGPYTSPAVNPYLTLQYTGVLWAVVSAVLARTYELADTTTLFVVLVGWTLLYLRMQGAVGRTAILAESPTGGTLRVAVLGGATGTELVPQGNEVLSTKDVEEETAAAAAGTVEEGEELWHACNDQEAEDEYCEGGYHRVHVGDVYNSRYRILCKLGWGKFSTVWLVQNQMKQEELSALKVCKSTQEFGSACLYEVSLLQKMAKIAEYGYFLSPNLDFIRQHTTISAPQTLPQHNARSEEELRRASYGLLRDQGTSRHPRQHGAGTTWSQSFKADHDA